MPSIPSSVTFNNSSIAIMNAIRNDASTNYQSYVPVATQDTEVIRSIGKTLMNQPTLQNEFIHSLVNRIAKTLISSRSYNNPLAMFKKGMLEYGEVIQDLFIEIAKPFTYNPQQAESTVFKREIPTILSSFYVMNYQKYYKQTVQRQSLSKAFLSIDGVSNLISGIIESMYNAMNYDEFLTIKYMLARHILDGKSYPVTIPNVEENNIKSVVATVKEVSNKLTFMNNKYNIAKVRTHSEKADQILLSNTGFDALIDVNVLASVFNLSPVEFLGNRVLIDSFSVDDMERLNELFADEPSYTALTEEENTSLNMIVGGILDRDFFQIYDQLFETGEKPNEEGLYWNYWVHTWKTFATSPYANNIIFVQGTPSVTSVAISPNTAKVSKGQALTLIAQVVTENFASKRVVWSVNSTLSTITPEGVLQVGESETATTLTVTCTSIYDSTKKATATITVG
jgi:hypothetical protein